MSKLLANKSQRDNFRTMYELVDDTYHLNQISRSQRTALKKCYENTKYKFRHKLLVDDYYGYFAIGRQLLIMEMKKRNY